MSTLVIVESPGKIQKIKKILGNGYDVAASMGHLRDLGKGLGSIDVDNNFKPKYINIDSKLKTIKDLKTKAKNSDNVIIASDLDREGEAIGYHICKCLGLDIKTTPRIVFTEITKKAIDEAINNPRKLDMNMVNAQQARRILDRLVGFELSPILWAQLDNNKLSAGRCQSPALKLITDREDTINKFNGSGYFSGECILSKGEDIEFDGEFKDNFKNKEEVNSMMELAKVANFVISDIKKTKSKHSPSAPFITSSLQQEASNKLSMNPKSCMEAAQTLYEKGKITYMRTDSTCLSKDCMDGCKDYITNKWGKNYYKHRVYNKKVANSQEAHEAIRPVQMSEDSVGDDCSSYEKKLYKLIWKRTIMSQMEDQKLDVHKIITKMDKYTINSSYDVETFDGYTIVDGKNKENPEDILELVNSLEKGDTLEYISITCEEKWTKPIGRFTEASLIKELEKMGIGRPSTYSNIVTTIQDRNYVIKDTKEGVEKEMSVIKLKGGKVTEKKKKKKVDGEKNKLFPTDLGMNVIGFMGEKFNMILDYKYTSTIEDHLDNISNGDSIWHEIVKHFYDQFHPIVSELKSTKKVYTKGENIILGEGIELFKNKFGKVIKYNDKYINLDCFKDLKSKDLENITYEDIEYLLDFPINIGNHEDKPIVFKYGQHGLYFTCNNKNYSVKGDISSTSKLKMIMREWTCDKCIDYINQTGKTQGNGIIKEFKDIIVRNGRYGPYVANGKKNASIPKTIDPKEITLEQCKTLLKQKK